MCISWCLFNMYLVIVKKMIFLQTNLFRQSGNIFLIHIRKHNRMPHTKINHPTIDTIRSEMTALKLHSFYVLNHVLIWNHSMYFFFMNYAL
jgi:hypothetical protein